MSETIDQESTRVLSTPRILLVFGIPVILFNALLTGRIVWEETWLTYHFGPQMLGFSLVHGYFWFLMFAPFLSVIWLIVALIVLALRLWRRRSLSKWYWSTLAAAILVLGILAVPPAFWQWASIRTFAHSPYAAELMVYAAREGDLRIVQGYLDHGVAITATDHDGATLAFAAAASGNVPLLKLLSSRGADLNALDAYGDSPLAAAIGNHHTAAADYLKAHGARSVTGTSEQREAAIRAIVQREIERRNREIAQRLNRH